MNAAEHPPVEVVSAIPGRVRLRVPASHRNPVDLQQFAAGLRRLTGVERVTTNHRTGSVLVTGTVGTRSLDGAAVDEASVDDGILDDLDEIGNVLSFGMGGAEVDGIASQLGSTIARLNRRLYEATGENYHLGTLVPGSMAVVGVWQTVRTGLGLELIPGPLMLWLAWDLYRSFGRDPNEDEHADAS